MTTKTPQNPANGPTRHAERPTGTRCTEPCIRPAPSQAHCTVCHRTFGGASNFDRHRRDGWCTDPAELGMEPNKRGIWVNPMSDQARAILTAGR